MNEQKHAIIWDGVDTGYNIYPSPLRVLKRKTQKQQKFSKSQSGHKTVQVIFNRNNEKFKKKLVVKRLLATYFIPNPEDYKYVDYKDSNKENLSLDNLIWVKCGGRKTGTKTKKPKIKTSTGERWRRFNEKYLVSTYGRVKDSNNYEVTQSIIVKGGRCHTQVHLTNTGYKRVSHLVAGDTSNDQEKLEILHKDGNTMNNRKNNLRWATHAEILAHNRKFPIQWKEIPEKEGFEVSNTGILRSFNGKCTRGEPNNPGYFRFKFGYNDTLLAHRVVAKAFIPNDDPLKIIVNHKNGDKKDNRVSNLEWETPSGNQLHACRTGLRTNTRQMKAVIQYDISGKKLGEFCSTLEASRQTGVCQSEISRVARKGGSSKSYQWRFSERENPQLPPPTDLSDIPTFRNPTGDEIRQFSLDGKLVGIYESARKAYEITKVKHPLILNSCGWWRCYKNGEKPTKNHRQLAGLGMNKEKWAWVHTKDYGPIIHLDISLEGKHDSTIKAIQEICPDTGEVIKEWPSCAAVSRDIGIGPTCIRGYCRGTKNNKDGRKFRYKD